MADMGMKKSRGETGDLFTDAGLLASLMDILPDYIYFKDLDCRFVRINKALVKYFGISNADEAIGKTDYDFFDKSHGDVTLADEQRIIGTGMSIVGKEERESWPDGSISWVSSTKAPLYDSDGKIVGTFGVSRDITTLKKHEAARKALETKMLQSDKLESLGMLASGIAHDFNNLLMGVLGNTSLAMMQLPDESPITPILKEVEAASVRASDLTNQLLAYAGRGSVKITSVDMTKLVKEMTKLLDVTISKSVSIRYDFAEDLPKVQGDATQLRQVVMNLITNASDAVGDRSGTITLVTRSLDCDEEYLLGLNLDPELKPGMYVYLEVSDTGGGMPKELAQKIFDPFFTTKPSGRGLGLATVHGIVRGHKGGIKVYSEEGKGTTFKVLLHCAEHPTEIEQRQKQEAEHHKWRGSGTALVVDDEDIIRDVSTQMVEALGFKSLSASSGWEAIEIFKEKKDEIAVVLLDEVMPRMDGEEVYAEMRKIQADVTVVLCSGYTERDATSRFVGKSLAGFIQKPFSLDDLGDALRTALE